MSNLGEQAMSILDELHTERLAYESEYVPLADAANLLTAYEETGMTPEGITKLLARAEAAEARAEKAERERDAAIQYMRKTFGWCTGCVHFTGIYGSGCKIGEMSTCGEENNHYVFCKEE